MLKIVEIAKAWIAAANPTPKQKATAEYRVLVCNSCPNKKEMKQFNTYVCGLCGCPLDRKIFSPLPGDQACPEKRWKQ